MRIQNFSGLTCAVRFNKVQNKVSREIGKLDNPLQTEPIPH